MREEIRQVAGEIGTFSNTWKVLIFDEDIETIVRHAEPFEAQGFEVHKCMSIESAMRCVEREEFDIAVVDQSTEDNFRVADWTGVIFLQLMRARCRSSLGETLSLRLSVRTVGDCDDYV